MCYCAFYTRYDTIARLLTPSPPLPQPPLLEVARIQHHDVQAFHDLGACGGTIFTASSCRTRLGTRVSIGLERASSYTADALPS